MDQYSPSILNAQERRHGHSGVMVLVAFYDSSDDIWLSTNSVQQQLDMAVARSCAAPAKAAGTVCPSNLISHQLKNSWT
jgi:hypothetical protein